MDIQVALYQAGELLGEYTVRALPREGDQINILEDPKGPHKHLVVHSVVHLLVHQPAGNGHLIAIHC